jgi:hypothetical protein
MKMRGAKDCPSHFFEQKLKCNMEPITTDSDKCDIAVKLSYIQIKYLILKWTQYQTTSAEGQILQQLGDGLKKYLRRKAKDGNMPQEIIDEYFSKIQKQSIPEEIIEYVDKSTIQIKQGTGNE